MMYLNILQLIYFPFKAKVLYSVHFQGCRLIQKQWETKFSPNSRAVEFRSLHTLRECYLFPREGGCSDRHDQDFSCCGWTVMRNVSGAFVHLLQCLAEKEITRCLQEK